MLTDNQLLAIHRTIHSKASGVKLNGSIFNIQLASQTNCRFIQFGDIKFIEQNKNNNSFYAQEACAGSTITWAIPKAVGHKWGLIKDNQILKPIPRT